MLLLRRNVGGQNTAVPHRIPSIAGAALRLCCDLQWRRRRNGDGGGGTLMPSLFRLFMTVEEVAPLFVFILLNPERKSRLERAVSGGLPLLSFP